MFRVVGENENWNSIEGTGRREDYTRLRHEITQEGEQLLSDLRSINLLQDHRPQVYFIVLKLFLFKYFNDAIICLHIYLNIIVSNSLLKGLRDAKILFC